VSDELALAAVPSAVEGGVEIVRERSRTTHSNALQELRAANFRQLRRRRQVERVCRLGPRVVFECFDELIARGLVDATDLDRQLARYARLDPATLALAGGDRFPPVPLHLVAGGRS
jgi:hypothetical protein